MKLFITATLFTLGLAAPVTETKPRDIAVGGAFSCPGGLMNNIPMCCSVNVLGVLALDCQLVGPDGCQGSLKPNCCTFSMAEQGLDCTEQ